MNSVTKSGVHLLKLCVLLCCAVSFRNTALGLKMYVFGEEKALTAYVLSFVIQCVIGVVSLRYMAIMEKINPSKGKLSKRKKFRKKWINLVSFIAFAAFALSILFDYVYIVNSTYEINEANDKMIGISYPFSGIKSEASEWLAPCLNNSHNAVYEDIKNVYSNTPAVGSSIYSEPWDRYWAKERNNYNLNQLAETINVNINDIVASYGIWRNNLNYTPLFDKDYIDRFKNDYAQYDIYSYLVQIIDSITAVKPDIINEEFSDSIDSFIHGIQTHISHLIQLENNPEAKFDEEDPYQGRDIIFSKQKAIEENLAKNNVDTWQYQLGKGKADLYAELSELRISCCKKALSKIDEYKMYFDDVKNDARYNVQLLITELSETNEIKIEHIEGITTKISNAMFADNSSNTSLDDKVKYINQLSSDLSYYIPLKNIDYLMKNFKFVPESRDEITADKKLEDGKAASSDSEKSDTVKNEKAGKNKTDEEAGISFDKGYAKEQIDLMIQYMSNLAANNNSSIDIDKYNVSNTIKKLTALEDVFLNEKNSLIEAFNFFKNKNKMYYDRIGEDSDASKALQETNNLAFKAMIFAIIIDCLSLFIGNIAQKWENNA